MCGDGLRLTHPSFSKRLSPSFSLHGADLPLAVNGLDESLPVIEAATGHGHLKHSLEQLTLDLVCARASESDNESQIVSPPPPSSPLWPASYQHRRWLGQRHLHVSPAMDI